MGMGLAKHYRRLDGSDVERVRTGLTSLSPTLLFSDSTVVYRFCHTLTARIGRADGLLVAGLDANVHEATTENVLRSVFDGVLEVRRRDGREEARAVGLPGAAEWTPI